MAEQRLARESRPKPRRLVLWDVDGTLLTGGAVAREAFDDAVAAVLGRDASDHGVQMSGKTDPQIAIEIMERVGLQEAEALERLPRVLEELELRLRAQAGRLRTEGRRHPGTLELLETLAADPEVLQSVLTGNLKPNAVLKLAAFGLEGFLDLEVGAYGSDHRVRDELIPVALRRVEERHGWRLAPSDTWVVGDTPADLACAKAGGARCLLVGTGRYAAPELEGLGADAVLADLSDTPNVRRLLTGP
jgi:phosphoglycolate phosphatase